MKTLVVKDIELGYKVSKKSRNSCGNSYTSTYTSFYKGTEEVKYGFFGKTKTVPKFIFDIEYDIESPYYTKENITYYVMSGFERWQNKLEREREIAQRKVEISKGELINKI